LNTGAEKDGWLFKIKVDNEKDLSIISKFFNNIIGELMEEKEYRKFVEEQKAGH
jgi:glycine cleavage system H lipoate-binding protein